MKPTLTQKRNLSAALKELHGDRWHTKMKPIHDEDGCAIYIQRFNPAFVDAIAECPGITWLELSVDEGNKLPAVREMISQLLPALAESLYYLEIGNCNLEPEPMRAAIPKDVSCFENLSKIERVVFDEVDANDRTLKAICSNPSLRDLNLRNVSATKRSLRYIESHKNLDIVTFLNCRHFPRSFDEKLKARLPRCTTVRAR